MSKLKMRLLKTMDKYCSNTESKILTYYVVHQNSFGFAGNMYHNDIIDLLGISKSQYYWCMDRMDREMIEGQPERPVPEVCPKCGSPIEEGKHDYHCSSGECSFRIRKDPYSRPRLIFVDRSKNKRYWDVLVFDNIFREYDKQLLKADAEDGYIDLNKDFILTKEFMSLDKGAYIAALKLMGFMDEKNPYQKYEIYEQKFMAWFNTTSKELFNKEIEALKPWFVITANEKKKYYIYLKKEHFSHDSADVVNFAGHIMNVTRYYKKRITGMSSREIARLAGQYKKKLLKLGVRSIDAIREALYKAMQGYKKIEERLVHTILKEYIKKLEEQGGKNGPGEPTPAAGSWESLKEKKKPEPQQGYKKKPSFNNFKNREYNTEYLMEYLKCRDDEGYLKEKYLSRGITLEDLFAMANKK